MQFSAARRPQALKGKLEEREEATAAFLLSWQGVLKPADFVYPSPQWVVVKGLYQKHGQPDVHMHAFRDLLLKRRYLLYIFLLLPSPELLLNTLFPGTWCYCGGRGLGFFFPSSN